MRGDFPVARTVRKVAGKRGVSVSAPPPDWPLEVTLDGQAYRLARPGLDLVEFADGGDRVPRGGGRPDDLVARRARVWRVALPPLLRTLPPSSAAGLLDFAEAVERVSAAGGSAWIDGGGGGRATPQGPSLAAVAAAERLRRMRAALAEPPAMAEIVTFRGPRDRHVIARTQVPLAVLAFAAAVERLSRRELARRLAGSDRAGTVESVTVGVASAGRRLAACCGYAGATVTLD